MAPAFSWTPRRTSQRGQAGSRTSLLCIVGAVIIGRVCGCGSLCWEVLQLSSDLASLSVCGWMSTRTLQLPGGARLARQQISQQCCHHFMFLSNYCKCIFPINFFCDKKRPRCHSFTILKNGVDMP